VSILVTGATGSLGPSTTARLLRRDSVVALVRHGEERAASRFEVFRGDVARADPEAPVDRLGFVAGDLAAPDAGLGGDDRDALAERVTRVLHLAAATRFSLSMEEARAGNLQTTLAALALAETLPRLEAMLVASTLYVAGTRTGTILEEDLVETTFVNTYERAKHEAEREVRARMRDLPLAVARVATILGSSRTGEVRVPTALHQAIRLAHRGLVPMIPGEPSQTIEVLDAEHAGEAMAALLVDAFEPGATYHVTAGPERCFTLAELFEVTLRLFAELDPAWGRRGIEPPALVPPETYALFERTVREAGDPAMTRILRGLSTFLPQLIHPKRFDRSRLVGALPSWDPPATEDYYPLVLASSIESDWGRARAEASP